ncbi:MAG TPA: type II toxin-antitoxin system VapC family toxin [Terriglobales bacterium]|nr:type II toxin-antitoxin system VapC family toxin [Terriglobales bacterium]
MNFLLDTHLLLWTTNAPERRSAQAEALIEDRTNQLWFSVASIWELAIKHNRQHRALEVDLGELRRALLQHGYLELPITGAHALATGELPRLHKDPFDRILIAQATVERLTLLTTDARLARYPGPVRVV